METEAPLYSFFFFKRSLSADAKTLSCNDTADMLYVKSHPFVILKYWQIQHHIHMSLAYEAVGSAEIAS